MRRWTSLPAANRLTPTRPASTRNTALETYRLPTRSHKSHIEDRRAVSSTTRIYRDLAIAFSGALVRLTDGPLEQPVPGEIGNPQWSWIGPAFIARLTEITAGIQHLVDPGLETEVASLTRSLYEHAVVFAWIGADPAKRLRQWLRVDAGNQLKTHKAFEALGVTDFLPPIVCGLYTSLADDPTLDAGFPRDLAGMACAADSDWPRSGKLSFTVLYTAIFRQFSSVLHPTMLGLTLHATPLEVSPGDSPQVILSYANLHDEATAVTTVVPLVLERALIVSADVLGWPDKSSVIEVTARYAGALAAVG